MTSKVEKKTRKIHEKVKQFESHEMDKVFECQHCGNSFARAQHLAKHKTIHSDTKARFLLFFYSIDIDRLGVDLGYICDRDPNFSKGVTVELE